LSLETADECAEQPISTAVPKRAVSRDQNLTKTHQTTNRFSRFAARAADLVVDHNQARGHKEKCENCGSGLSARLLPGRAVLFPLLT
jgi:hypothetical protein